MGIIKLKTRNTMKWSNRETLKTWVWTDVKSSYQNDEKQSHIAYVAGYSLFSLFGRNEEEYM